MLTKINRKTIKKVYDSILKEPYMLIFKLSLLFIRLFESFYSFTYYLFLQSLAIITLPKYVDQSINT